MINKRFVGLAVLVLLAFLLMRWLRPSVPSEVTHARPGMAWRVPGGVAAPEAAAPTIEGLAIPSWFGQRGAPVRRIAGHVTSNGAPVMGASVALVSELSYAGVAPPLRRVTDAAGAFDFGTQPPAQFNLSATAEGLAPGLLEVDARDPTIATDRLELDLFACRITLSGHVKDSSAGPIAGAHVCLVPPAQGGACSTARADGAFSICLSPQSAQVAVTADGYGGIFEAVEYRGARLTRDFTLSPEGRIVGRVVREDGSPVPAANLRVLPVDRGQRFAAPVSATADNAGHFVLKGLAPGWHRVWGRASGLGMTDPVDVNVDAGRTSELVIRVRAEARVSGVVTDGRSPVAGARVSVSQIFRKARPDAVTQADGSFVLDGVATGPAHVWVTNFEVDEPRSITIDREEVTGVRIRVEPQSSIAGRVIHNGQPVSGAQVRCTGSYDQRSGRLSSVYTDRRGAFEFSGLSAGNYALYAESATIGAYGESTGVSVGKGEHKGGVDVDLKYASTISGTIVEANGSPVANAAVTFVASHSDDMGRDITAPDGSFTVRALMGGDDYRVTIESGAHDFRPLRPAHGEFPVVHVDDGASNVGGVQFVVQRDHLAISGKVVDGENQPISDVRVVAYPNDADASTLSNVTDTLSATSASDGTFSITEIDGGAYTLRAHGGDGSEAVVRDVSAGRQNVVIKLDVAGGIDGTLVGFKSQPEVRAVRQIPGAVLHTILATVDGRSFRIRGLSAGSYQVAAVGEASDSQLVEVRPGTVAQATLTARGRTTIHGRVVDWRTGAPVPNMKCVTGLRGNGMPIWMGASVAVISGPDGSVTFDDAPTGDISVGCTGGGYANGRADLSAINGQDATFNVAMVRIIPDVPFGSIGAQFDIGSMPVTVLSVAPGSSAARTGVRPGDIVTTLDGLNALNLTAQGVQVVVAQRRLGTTVHLGLSRGEGPVAVDVAVSAQ